MTHAFRLSSDNTRNEVHLFHDGITTVDCCKLLLELCPRQLLHNCSLFMPIAHPFPQILLLITLFTSHAAQTTIWLLFAEDSSVVAIACPLGDHEAEKISWFWLV
jgi:hypothetical protein